MMWERIKTEVRHNQFLVSAIATALVLVLWVYGCESKTASPWNPDEQLTRTELILQVEHINAKVKAAEADLDKQDMFKQELVTVGVAIAEGGGINPAGVGVGVMLLGILGLSADNRKKNAIIQTLKNSGGTNGSNGSTTTA